jgi:DNA-binding NarL/FixJ family response regulator
MDYAGEAEAVEPTTQSGNGGDAAGRCLRLFISVPRRLLRENLATALGRDERFEVIGRDEGAAAMLEQLARCTADILVLGADTLDGELIHLTREVAARFPALKILVLSRAGGEGEAVDCLMAGAGGFLPLDRPLSEVAGAIEVVARGDKVCPPQVMRELFARLGELGRERKRRDRLEVLELSAREMEILRLIADGKTNQEIARQLYLSVHTVKNHVHRILDALDVQNRWAAVRHAFAKGWLHERRGS